jgi:hypothetical protein
MVGTVALDLTPAISIRARVSGNEGQVDETGLVM